MIVQAGLLFCLIDLERPPQKFIFERGAYRLVEKGNVDSVVVSIVVEQADGSDSAPFAVAPVAHLLAGTDYVAAFQPLGADDADDAAASLQGAPGIRRCLGDKTT